MKTVGIIGGFGPETTATFQCEVIAACSNSNPETRPPMLMWNTPIPQEIEFNLIQKSEGIDAFLPFLIHAAKKLEAAGSDFLVLPCNTLHLLADKIRQAVSIPMLHIIEETGNTLNQQHVNKIGLLATHQSVASNIHKNIFKRHDIDCIIPPKNQQQDIDNAIQSILNHTNNHQTENNLRHSITNFQMKGINNIVLGCTDLQCATPTDIKGVTIHDTMKILATATAREICKE